MANRLAEAVSPYLRSHADNPVDWREWGADAFAEAAARQVPLLVSIGYSTCHWCHVMARESFSDPQLAEQLNEHFVAIKVDREEYPDVDASYLAAAGAFTGQLGWPLNVFVTPEGKAFYAGTYWPPRSMQGHPAFRDVLDAVTDAWLNRRDEVESTADALASAIAAQSVGRGGTLPTGDTWARIIRGLEQFEDTEFGGFGEAPKFPMAPVLLLLLERGSAGAEDSADATALAERTLDAMAASDLRDPVEGGFFRYSTMRDWTDPHYERMLYDNAMLLDAYSLVPGEETMAAGIADFLKNVLRLPSGAFASAQDSESMVDGVRVEGGYYRLDPEQRASQPPPALDEKVLTGWNGLAIGALARAGLRLDRPDWIALARGAADMLLARHIRFGSGVSGSGVTGSGGSGSGVTGLPLPGELLVRASIGDTISLARATLEDYGMLADGLVSLALATGEVRYAISARRLVDATLVESNSSDPHAADAHAAEDGASAGDGGTDAGAGAADPGATDPGATDPGATDSGATDPGATDAGGSDGVRDGTSASPASAPESPREVFRVPGGGDPVLAAHGIALQSDPSEGAYPSGLSSMASAAHKLYLLTADARYRTASEDAMASVAPLAVPNASSFGTALTVMTRLGADVGQLVIVTDEVDVAVASLARGWNPSGSITAIVTPSQSEAFADAGFELFEGRIAQDGRATAYLCRDFVCRLPITDAVELGRELLGASPGS